jgi:signal transduction histidine kinase
MLSARVGWAFALCMRVRMLNATVTLVLLPDRQLTLKAILLVTGVAVVSWAAAGDWDTIVPWLLAHPVLLALDLGLGVVMLRLGGLTGPFFLSTVVTSAVAGLLYRWPGTLAVVGLQIACFYGVYAWTGPPAALGLPLYYPLVGFLGMALRRLFDDQAERETVLRRAEVAAAAAQERARLAREMHDSLAKTLRGITLAATALPMWVRRSPDRAITEAHRIASATEIASREARDLLVELRETSVTRPLPLVLDDAAKTWAGRLGMDLTCEIDRRADLPLPGRHEVIAIFGEILANIEQHAEAGSVVVRLRGDGDMVELTVRDDGGGFEVATLAESRRAGHYGIVGLHERAARVGGTVRLTSSPGAGTTVAVRLPSGERSLTEVG